MASKAGASVKPALLYDVKLEKQAFFPSFSRLVSVEYTIKRGAFSQFDLQLPLIRYPDSGGCAAALPPCGVFVLAAGDMVLVNSSEREAAIAAKAASKARTHVIIIAAGWSTPDLLAVQHKVASMVRAGEAARGVDGAGDDKNATDEYRHGVVVTMLPTPSACMDYLLFLLRVRAQRPEELSSRAIHLPQPASAKLSFFMSIPGTVWNDEVEATMLQMLIDSTGGCT